MTESLSEAARQTASPRARRTLLLIAAIGIAPVVASYAAYYFWPPQARVNYGELLSTSPAPPFEGVRTDGRPFRLADLRGRWVLLMSSPARRDAVGERMLYATRQARATRKRSIRSLVPAQDVLLAARAPDRSRSIVLASEPGHVHGRIY
jgi:hypothetical protein